MTTNNERPVTAQAEQATAYAAASENKKPLITIKKQK